MEWRQIFCYHCPTNSIILESLYGLWSATIDNPEDRNWKCCGKSNDAGVTSVMRLNHETIICCPGNPPKSEPKKSKSCFIFFLFFLFYIFQILIFFISL
jgi:hypothetical protein